MSGKIYNRIYTLLLASLLLSLATRCFADEFTPFLGKVSGEGINVRIDSSVSADSITALKKGTKIEVVKELYEWYKIRLPQAVRVYVKKDFFECRETNINCQKAKATADKINVRLAPDLSSHIVGLVDQDEIVNVFREKDGYYQIQPPKNSYGWIHKNFVEKTSEKITEAPEIELAKLDKEEAINKPEVKLETEAKDGTIILEGVIKPKFFKKVATHKLITDTKEVFLLNSDKVTLHDFNYYKVRITGEISGPEKIIEVTKLEVLN